MPPEVAIGNTHLSRVTSATCVSVYGQLPISREKFNLVINEANKQINNNKIQFTYIRDYVLV